MGSGGSHSENKQIQLDIRELEAELEQKEKVIVDLRANLQVEIESSKRIKESANKMQHAMESKELFVGRQDSDDVIYSRFQTLIGQIKTWSVPFAQGRPKFKGEFVTEAIEHIRRVAPGVADTESFEEFLRVPKNMRLFVRGYVGFAVADHLFRSLPYSTPESYTGFHGADVWMDRRLVEPVSVLEESLLYAGTDLERFQESLAKSSTVIDRSKISDREFHDWRVLTTTLVARLDTMGKIGKGMESYLTTCCEHIMRLVGRWVGKHDRITLEEELQVILFSAVSLSRTLRCQRALWSVRQVGSPAPAEGKILYDQQVMEDKHGEEDSDGEDIPTANGKEVEIVVSPGLFKRGNTDGERFEFESCIERAEVKCR